MSSKGYGESLILHTIMSSFEKDSPHVCLNVWMMIKPNYVLAEFFVKYAECIKHVI